MVGIEGKRQVFGFAIATCDGKTDIDAALPAVHQAGMKLVLVSGLFGVVAHYGDIAGWGLNEAGFCGNVELAIRRGNRTDSRLATFEAYVEILVGLDLLDSVKFEFDVTGGIGVNYQRLAVGLNDGSGQPITIFQGDLVGEECGGKSKKRSEGQQFKLA